MAPPARGIVRLLGYDALRRLETKIVEPANRAHDGVESGGNRWFRGVGEVPLALHPVMMDFDPESVFDLGRVAPERHRVSGAGDGNDTKTLVAQPGNDLVYVALACAE